MIPSKEFTLIPSGPQKTAPSSPLSSPQCRFCSSLFIALLKALVYHSQSVQVSLDDLILIPGRGGDSTRDQAAHSKKAQVFR